MIGKRGELEIMMDQIKSNFPLLLLGLGVFIGYVAIAGTNITAWIKQKRIRTESDRLLAEMDKNVAERKTKGAS